MKMKPTLLFTCVLNTVLWNGVVSFQASRGTTNVIPTTSPPSSSRLYIIGVETIGIAVVSAAAGAATQMPRIQELEGELASARAALEKSNGDMVSKISELEDKLFQMDKAYEEQSAKFIKEYEQRKNEEVQKITEKIKTDYGYKLEIEVEREKSKLLSEKLSEVTLTGDQTTKLAEMKMKMNLLQNAKEQLETALEKSQAELKRIQDAGKNKGGFWRF